MSDLLIGGRDIDQLVHKNVLENVDFISTGSLPPNPSELLLRPTFSGLLHILARHYDMVLIDAPPLLAVSDSLIICSHSGAIFIATRAGVTTPGDIAESLKRLARAGLSAKGVLFNDMELRAGRYGYGSGSRYGKYRQLSYVGDVQRMNKSVADV